MKIEGIEFILSISGVLLVILSNIERLKDLLVKLFTYNPHPTYLISPALLQLIDLTSVSCEVFYSSTEYKRRRRTINSVSILITDDVTIKGPLIYRLTRRKSLGDHFVNIDSSKGKLLMQSLNIRYNSNG